MKNAVEIKLDTAKAIDLLVRKFPATAKLLESLKVTHVTFKVPSVLREKANERLGIFSKRKMRIIIQDPEPNHSLLDLATIISASKPAKAKPLNGTRLVGKDRNGAKSSSESRRIFGTHRRPKPVLDPILKKGPNAITRIKNSLPDDDF